MELLKHEEVQSLFLWLIGYGGNLLTALVIFFIGKWLANFASRLIRKLLEKTCTDPTVTAFACNGIYTLLLVLVTIAALGKLGIQTTSLAAIVGATGLAVGLSVKGSLSNLAEGVLLIIHKHFKVGDFVEIAGTSGTVLEINLFHTKLRTGDNRLIIIPNGKIATGNITNYSAHKTRRIDLTFSIGYEDDIDKAKQILHDLLSHDNRVLTDPAPKVAVITLADSSVNLIARPWVKTGDYWNVHFDLTERVKKAFDQNKISMPYPQMDVHMPKSA